MPCAEAHADCRRRLRHDDCSLADGFAAKAHHRGRCWHEAGQNVEMKPAFIDAYGHEQVSFRWACARRRLQCGDGHELMASVDDWRVYLQACRPPRPPPRASVTLRHARDDYYTGHHGADTTI